MCENNSGLIAKTKRINNKKGLYLTEKLMRVNPLLFLYQTVNETQKSLPKFPFYGINQFFKAVDFNIVHLGHHSA